VREPAARSILTNSGALVACGAITAGLVLVYWFTAPRLFSVSVVGVAAALISTMTLLATLGVPGLSSVVVSELPLRRGETVRGAWAAGANYQDAEIPSAHKTVSAAS